MALAVSRYINQGKPDEYSDIYCNKIQVRLVEIRNKNLFVVEVQGSLKAQHEINANGFTQILPNVKMRAGDATTAKHNEVKILIEAPRAINLTRGECYPDKC